MQVIFAYIPAVRFTEVEKLVVIKGLTSNERAGIIAISVWTDYWFNCMRGPVVKSLILRNVV